MSNTAVDLSKKALVFVTGASRGIGKAIAIELAKIVADNSAFVLTARSKANLTQTCDQIAEINRSIQKLPFGLDFGNAKEVDYKELLENVAENVDLSSFGTSIFFHNAGYVGELRKATCLKSLQTWRDYYDVNLFSVAILNCFFIEKVRGIIPKVVLVNITSLVGRKPYKDMVLYGSGKAARDLYFQTLAIEEPDLLVLNYSPGPVDTDMYNSIIETAESAEIRNLFKEVKENKTVLSPEQTVSKLLGILKEGKFKSGQIIDYFDRI